MSPAIRRHRHSRGDHRYTRSGLVGALLGTEPARRVEWCAASCGASDDDRSARGGRGHGRLRPGDQLVLGASNPVRDAALVGLDHARASRCGPTAASPASTARCRRRSARRWHIDGRRTVALIGDLTFVHDSSGLLIGPTEPTPRQPDDRGVQRQRRRHLRTARAGRPEVLDVSSRIFGTPHDVDVGALCRAYHVDSRQIEADELAGALERAVRGDAGAGGEGRPVVAAGAARVDQGCPVRGANRIAVSRDCVVAHG